MVIDVSNFSDVNFVIGDVIDFIKDGVLSIFNMLDAVKIVGGMSFLDFVIIITVLNLLIVGLFVTFSSRSSSSDSRRR